MTMMTKQKTNSKFTKAASLAASLALVLNGGVKFASAYDEQSIVCEHKTASISCPTGELISIVDGWYGRTEAAHVTGEPVVCPHSATSNRNCPFHKTGQYDAQKAKIGGACEGKNICSVKASNGYFGDPCGGTFKYLNISYNCVDPSAKEDAKAEESAADLQAALAQAQANVETNKDATVCEHKTLDIECGTGTVAKINSATYGRLKNGVCGNGSNTTCAARDGKYCGHGKNQQCQDSFSVVGAQCEGLQSCQVGASNGVFGDPCWGTFKYLTVNYDCIVPNEEEAQNEIKEQLLDPFKGHMILSTGCSPLSKLTFSTGETFSDRVGAKIITKSMDPDFKWDKGMEMTEVYCGTFAVDFTPADDEEFGFYLYDKLDPENELSAVSDIGCEGDAAKCPDGDIISAMDSCTREYEWNGAKSRNRFYKGDELYTWGSCDSVCAVEPANCPSDLVSETTLSSRLGNRVQMLSGEQQQKPSFLRPESLKYGTLLFACAGFGALAVRKYRESAANSDSLLTEKSKSSTSAGRKTTYNSIDV
ncbi:unnamed protein product [Bathycoccus prasinos]